MKPALTVLACAALSAAALAQQPDDRLAREFQSPPDSAKPRTWWHWTSGNVTHDGITKDLEWMKRVGIGGFQLSDVGAGGGQTVEPKVLFESPLWFQDVKYSAELADKLGLEMSLFSSAGWSETGGAWVKPEQAMKKLVWSETTVEGPQAFSGRLANPPSNNGPFSNLHAGIPRRAPGEPPPPPDPTFYGDSAVIAYRTPADESAPAALHPVATTSGGPIDPAVLLDGDLNTGRPIAAPKGGGSAWIRYEFPQAIAAQAVTIIAPGRGVPFGRFQASEDGVTYRTLVETPGPVLYRAGAFQTYSFPETKARFFRFEMDRAAAVPAGVMSQDETQPAESYRLSEFVVETGARVNRWEEKAGFSFIYDYASSATPAVPAADAIDPSALVDLTGKMDRDGTLHWDVPAGRWTILRMGYSLTGAKNRPAPPNGSGYEADKLSRKWIEDYFHGYFDPIAKDLGPLVGKSVRYMTMDSWEAEYQNWTDDMLADFQRLRGYDPRPYLPALAGRIVGSADQSDRFLWDFRRTLADLFARNHYGTMADLLHQRGMGLYAEASGVSMDIMEDTLLNKSEVDIPMGEFWVHALHPELQYYVDVRGAASAAHAYGKRIVGTESFTGGGYEAPYTLKRIGDYWLTQGVNRFMFHDTAIQPLDTKPGNTMVGTHLNRNMTWAEQAGPYMTYLSRCFDLLQQGLFVADFAYLLPEGVPSSQPFWGGGLKPELPAGYDYDCINTDVLLHRMSVGADGRLLLPDGMSYRVLILPESRKMTPAVAAKIKQLVSGGATIVGPRPLGSPSLAGYPQCDAEVRALANEVWGDLDGVMRNKQYYGRGTVFWGFPLDQVIREINLPKDFDYSRALDSDVDWIHRRDGDLDLYFVVNHTDQVQDLEARFRVAGKEAELWHPDTGAVEPAGYSIAGGLTTVPLHLEKRESVFVVFRHPAAAPTRALPRPERSVLATVEGPWNVSFPPRWGAPTSVVLPALQSWTANADAGVKYFSGTATYTKTVEAPDSWKKSGARVLLDLGDVRDLAQVSVNGHPAGLLWKQPYRLDVTDLLQPGSNRLEIQVTNQWTNRVIGDRLAPEGQKVLTSEPVRAFGRGPTLQDSGLLGPVTFVSQAQQ